MGHYLFIGGPLNGQHCETDGRSVWTVLGSNEPVTAEGWGLLPPVEDAVPIHYAKHTYAWRDTSDRGQKTTVYVHGDPYSQAIKQATHEALGPSCARVSRIVGDPDQTVDVEVEPDDVVCDRIIAGILQVRGGKRNMEKEKAAEDEVTAILDKLTDFAKATLYHVLHAQGWTVAKAKEVRDKGIRD